MELLSNSKQKSKKLNPLVKIVIDNMHLQRRITLAVQPTPFSDYSKALKLNQYDITIIQSVIRFNRLCLELGVPIQVNLLATVDSELKSIIKSSQILGARLPESKRKMSAVSGTSISLYCLLKYCITFRFSIFDTHPFEQIDLPGLDLYLVLADEDKLRILRYVDKEAFEKDLKVHNMVEWRHPDDPS